MLSISKLFHLYLKGESAVANDVEELFSLGLWVRRRRKALDLTQAELARRVGCAEVTIRKIEASVVRPSRAIAERLSRCLDLPAGEDELFLQVASGERSIQRLPVPLTGIESLVSRWEARAPQQDDTLPIAMPLPNGSRMPFGQNPLFVGRADALRELARMLRVRDTSIMRPMQTAAVTGIGGIGKTQLTCEFVHRYGEFFMGGVFWLNFADAAAIPTEVATCGGMDGMRLSYDFDTLPIDDQVKLVLAAWESALPRLLIFDGCEDEALLDRWRPRYGGSCVLITSRRREWSLALGVQTLNLSVLPRTDSIALLRQFRPDLPENDASLHAIAAQLGDLPLALHLAGSFLKLYQKDTQPGEYLSELQATPGLQHESLEGEGISPTGHDQSVARTFRLSYDCLDAERPIDALALRLLTRAASFAPGEPIPRDLLKATLDLPGAEKPSARQGTRALQRLVNLGLLEEIGDAFRLHRLLVAFVRSVAVDQGAQAAVEEVLLQLVDRLSQTSDPRPLQPIEAHLRFMTDSAQQRQDTRAAGLFSALGWYLELRAAYSAAQRCYEQALAIQQRILGHEHPDIARSLNSLGHIFCEQGEFVMAQRCHEQALAIQQRVLGHEHPDIAHSLNNLGRVLWEQGEFVMAQRCYEQALAIQEHVLGREHPDVACSLNSLGMAMEAQGDYAAAQRYHEQAVAIHERAVGREHRDTARFLHNLGIILWEQREFAAAQRCYEEALAIKERVLGREHPYTARSLSSLGQILWEQGDYAAARRYHEQALAIQERTLRPGHPDIAWSLNGLSLVLWEQGDYAAAQHCLERALAICEACFGPNHYETQSIRATLTTLCFNPH
jgi:tetratricopeptide (TPR) repeat protein/transcriptional regulator with XRE-family HTH domain